MKSIKLLWLTVLMLVGVFLAACDSSPTPTVQPTESSMMDDTENSTEMMDTEENHADDDEEHSAEYEEHEHTLTPDEYVGQTIPFTVDDTVITAGKAIYDTNCAACHGVTGAGDSAAAASLDPKPANLADTHMMAEVGDDYLFWRISEGGMAEPFNSLMPSWKQSLTAEERWEVVAYLRTLGQ